MTVEHRSPQSRAPSKINRYTNCLLACRFCNQARSDRPLTDSRKRHLLDPRHAVWGKRFHIAGDVLMPRLNDADAAYTFEAYDLGDERKRRCRESRRTRIEASLEVLATAEAREKTLLNLASGELNLPKAKVLVEVAAQLRQARKDAIDQLCRYQTTPLDAGTCGCVAQRRIPTWLEKQSLPVP